MADTGMKKVTCELTLFQETLKNMRTLEDTVAYSLNTSIPTESFKGQIDPVLKCRELHEELKSGRIERSNAIKHCINQASQHVEKLKSEKANDPDNIKVLSNLRREQNKLRMMRSELNIEEVIAGRTNKIFYEKCGRHYQIPEES